MPQIEPDAETTRIRQQLIQAFDGGAWHGPAVREILDGVDVRIARSRPIAGVHSIFEFVVHLVATQQILLRRLDGDATAIDLPHAEEWPPVADASETGWRTTLEQLAR